MVKNCKNYLKMKLLLLSIALLLSTICFSQDKTESNLFANIGISLQPAFSTQNVRNLEMYSALPSLNLSVGNDKAMGFLSVGAVTKLGIGTAQKYVYAIGSYTVNSTTLDYIEHGPEIEMGFNYRFGKNKQYRFWFGSSISMTLYSPRQLKIVLRPVIIGLSFNLLNKWISRF